MRQAPLGVAAAVVVVVLGGCADGEPAVDPSASSSLSAAAKAVVVVAVYQPLCGGPEPVTPDPSCPQEVVEGVEIVATRPGSSVVATARTDAQGRAVLRLPAGGYVLTAGPAEPPRVAPRPMQVTVGPEPVPTVTLRYESSMQ